MTCKKCNRAIHSSDVNKEGLCALCASRPAPVRRDTELIHRAPSTVSTRATDNADD